LKVCNHRVITDVITRNIVLTMHALTVTSVGNSLGVVLPKEVTSLLNLKKGDKVFLTKSPDGYRITPYDPEFEEQMKAARSVMQKRRNALRELAK
jgi:putative addiction module antidote